MGSKKRNDDASQSSSPQSGHSKSSVSRSPSAESNERSASEDERRRASVSGSSKGSSPRSRESSRSNSRASSRSRGSSRSGSPGNKRGSSKGSSLRSREASRSNSSLSRDSSRSGSPNKKRSSDGSNSSRTPEDSPQSRQDSPQSSDSRRDASGSGSKSSSPGDQSRKSSDSRASRDSRGSQKSGDSKESRDSRDSKDSRTSESGSDQDSRGSSASKMSSSDGSRSPSLSRSEADSEDSPQALEEPRKSQADVISEEEKEEEATAEREMDVDKDKTVAPEEPSLPPKGPTDAVQTVSLSMKVNNVLHSALMSNTTLLTNFTAGVKESIAEEAGNGILPDHVEVRLSPGSVIVQATIVPPQNIPADSVRSSLESPKSGFQNLVNKVQALPGIKAISTGPIGVSEVTQPTISERKPTKKLGNGQFEVVAEASDKSLGFTTNREQRREIIYTLDQGSWAEKVGIRVFDELVKANGLSTQAMQPRDLFAQLQHRPLPLVIMPMRVTHTTLKILMVGCHGLRKLARMGESRIFCSCDLTVSRGEPIEKQIQVTTPSISGSRSPKWFHTSEVPFDDATKALKFNVWDQDNVAKDLLGKVNLPTKKYDPHGFEGELILEDAGIGAVLKVKVEIVKHEGRGSTSTGLSEDMAAKANLEALTQMRERAQKELEDQLEKRIHDKEVELKAENRVLELQIKELQAKLVAAELAKARDANREQEHEQRMAFARKEVLLEQQHKKAMKEKEAEIRVFKAKLIEAEATALALKRSATAVLQQPANEALVKAQQRRAEQEIDELKIRLAQAELGLQTVKESMEHEVVPIEVQTSPRLLEEVQTGSQADYEMDRLRIKLAQAEASLKAMPRAVKNAPALLPESMLRVEVISARGLQKGDSTRELDTYCTCEVLPRKLGMRLRTKTMRGKAKPSWNHTEEFRFDDDITMLKFTIWHDGMAEPVSLGVAGLARSRFDPDGFSGELLLQDGGPQASVTIKITPAKPGSSSAQTSKKVSIQQSTRLAKPTSEGKQTLTKTEKAERRKLIQETRSKIRETEMARIEEEFNAQENEKAALDERSNRPTPRDLQVQGKMQKKLEMEEDALRRQLRADQQLVQASNDSAQRHAAAAKIQAATRGSVARSKVQKMRQARDEQWKKQQRQLERDAVNRRLQALQAKEAQGKEDAATKIQAGFRGMAARRSVELMIEELGSRRYSQVYESINSSPSPRFQTGAGSCGNLPPYSRQQMMEQRFTPRRTGSGPSSGRAAATRPEALRSAGYPVSGGGGHLPGPGGIPPPAVVPIMPIAGGTASFADSRVPIGRGAPATSSGVLGPPQTRTSSQGPPAGGSMAASQRIAETAGESVFRPASRHMNTAGRPGPPDRIQRSEAIQRASEVRRGGGAGQAIFKTR